MPKSVWRRENVKRCLSPANIALSQHSHLQYLRIPSSPVNIPCTVEHETSSSSAITLTVVLLSMLTMSLTKSFMEQVTTAGWPLLKSSSVDSLPLLNVDCIYHIFPLIWSFSVFLSVIYLEQHRISPHSATQCNHLTLWLFQLPLSRQENKNTLVFFFLPEEQIFFKKFREMTSWRRIIIWRFRAFLTLS